MVVLDFTKDTLDDDQDRIKDLEMNISTPLFIEELLDDSLSSSCSPYLVQLPLEPYGNRSPLQTTLHSGRSYTQYHILLWILLTTLVNKNY